MLIRGGPEGTGVDTPVSRDHGRSILLAEDLGDGGGGGVCGGALAPAGPVAGLSPCRTLAASHLARVSSIGTLCPTS